MSPNYFKLPSHQLFSPKNLLTACLLFLPVVIFFSPVIFEGKLPLPADTIPALHHPIKDALKNEYPNGPPYKNFLITDPVRQQYPWRQFSIEQLKSGELPWWNPYNFSGTPHLANLQSASFYPLNFLFWIVDFTQAWSIQVISQQFLGALFLFLYLKNQKLSRYSSIFGAITWIFSGFFIAWLEWNTAVHVALWSPLILLSIDKLFTDKPSTHKALWSAILVFSLSSQFLAGYPQPWLYLTLFQSAYFLATTSRKHFISSSIKFSLLYLLFIFIVSIQLLPALNYIPLTNRTLDQGGSEYNLVRDDWFIPCQHLIQVIVPDYFGNPATLNYFGVFNYTEFVSYIGVISFFMVLIALTNRHHKKTKFFTASLIIAFIFAIKNPISLLTIKLDLPFLGSSQPSRIIVLLNLILAILSAIGFDRFFSKKTTNRTIPSLILGITLLLIWGFTLNTYLNTPHTPEILTTLRNSALPILEFIFITITAIVVSRSIIPSKFSKQILPIAIILTTSLLGIRFGSKFTSFSDPSFLYPPSKILDHIASDGQYYRYSTTDRRIMYPNLNMAYKLYSIEGYDPMYLAGYGQLLSASSTLQLPPQSKAFNRILTIDDPNSPLLDLLSVKYLLTFDHITDPSYQFVMQEGDTLLYQNTQVFPRAFITTSDSLTKTLNEQIIPATITSYTPNKVIITATATQSAYLVLTDSYHPDWQITLNSISAEVINWNGLRATIIPRGTHEIIHHYSYPKL